MRYKKTYQTLDPGTAYSKTKLSKNLNDLETLLLDFAHTPPMAISLGEYHTVSVFRNYDIVVTMRVMVMRRRSVDSRG